MKKSLCVVPARAGSKRLPGKNIKKLFGRELIFHTLDLAVKYFDFVMFSSDSRQMVEKVKKEYEGRENILSLVRNPELAMDTSKVIDTVNFFFERTEKRNRTLGTNEFSTIWLLLPTCPLRNDKDIIETKKLLTKDVDNVISVTDYDFPPTLGLKLDGMGFVREEFPEPSFSVGNSRSQDQERIYRPNGAIYGSNWRNFRMNRNFYKGIVRTHYMPRERSVDIDTDIDFKLAEIILREREEKNK